MKKNIIITFAGLALLAGCGPASNNTSGIPVPPKWKGAPYRLAFGAAPAKPGASGLTLPPIKFTANPDMLETRANLVVEFDASGAKSDGPAMDQMVVGAVDIHGSEGALPADYLKDASDDLAKTLESRCVKGKVKIAVALTRSSIPLNATADQVNDHRLSDWTPIEIEFKNPHPKC